MPGIPDVEKDAARRIGVKGREGKRERERGRERERETLHVGLARFSGGQWRSPCYQYCLVDAEGPPGPGFPRLEPPTPSVPR